MNNTSIIISVIIPSYKPQDYIWECLESVYNQTLSGGQYEVIIILNGCNEPYRSQIEDYITRHSDKCSFRLIQTDTPGVSNARNIGIDKSEGEYLTFVDDDDVISPTYLEELLNVSNKTTVGCANSFYFQDDITIRQDNFLTTAFNKVQNKPYNIYMYRQFLSPPVDKLIHRDIIGEERFPVSLRRSEDSVFCLRISGNIKKLQLTSPSAIYYIRQRNGSATRNGVSIKDELHELGRIEAAYFKYWTAHPFSVNLKFVLSRIVAGLLNSYWRLKRG